MDTWIFLLVLLLLVVVLYKVIAGIMGVFPNKIKHIGMPPCIDCDYCARNGVFHYCFNHLDNISGEPKDCENVRYTFWCDFQEKEDNDWTQVR